MLDLDLCFRALRIQDEAIERGRQERYGDRFQQIRKEEIQEKGYFTIAESDWFSLEPEITMLLHGSVLFRDRFRPPQQKWIEHKHAFFEMSYVYRGSFHNYVEGQHIVQPENTLVLLSPQARHHCCTECKDDLVFNILIRQQTIETVFLRMFSESGALSRFFLDAIYNMNQQQPYMIFKCGAEEESLVHLACDGSFRWETLQMKS